MSIFLDRKCNKDLTLYFTKIYNNSSIIVVSLMIFVFLVDVSPIRNFLELFYWLVFSGEKGSESFLSQGELIPREVFRRMTSSV